MEPRIEQLTEKRLVGKNLRMSFSQDNTIELWRSFMPRRKEIGNTVSADLYSLQVFDSSFFDHFNPEHEFEKWALVEVTDFDGIPDGMAAFTIPAGLYAVFHYIGLSTDAKIFDYIFRTWLPGSDYSLDNRPHFTVMGEKYKNADANSEEHIWIPIKPKR